MDEIVGARSLESDVPPDTAAPAMYRQGTWLLAGIAALCVLALGLIAGFRGTISAEVVTALVAIAGPAVTGLASIYNRKGG